MKEITQIRSLSLWIFLIPFISINLCLLISVNAYIFDNTFFSVDQIGRSGFTIPYLDGSLSISRASRTFPQFLIFKPAMVATAFLLYFYWQKNNLLIYQWHGTDNSYNTYVNNIKINNLPIEIKKTSISLEERVRRKFGVYGTVVGLYDKSTGFYGLEFLKVVTFNDWLDAFKNKDIEFDPGLTTLGNRQRNQWRSSAKFMRSLVVSTYIPLLKIP